ncbi:zinc ribbon domain-containing protein [Alkalinema pantanalense CENA528]|uniref:zinc ribbon domain-containing protein n=1 Tax=Alkalinema pantanalense TaxID=1620705 RepID=UPI003D6F4F5D
MPYLCELNNGQRIYLDNIGQQTTMTIASSQPGQQQQSGTSFTTGAWVAPPEALQFSNGAVIKLRTEQGELAIQVQGSSAAMVQGFPAGSQGQALQMQQTATMTGMQPMPGMQPIPEMQPMPGMQPIPEMQPMKSMPGMQPMQPMQPMRMGDMQMNSNPMEMRMGNMEMRMGNPTANASVSSASAASNVSSSVSSSVASTGSSSAELNAKRFCTQCGNAVQPTDRFCASCGHQLS